MPRFGGLDAAFGRLGANGRSANRIIPGVITAQKGTFNITGMDANLIASHNPLVAAAGAFSITGIDAALTYSGSGATQNDTAVFISNLQY